MVKHVFSLLHGVNVTPYNSFFSLAGRMISKPSWRYSASNTFGDRSLTLMGSPMSQSSIHNIKRGFSSEINTNHLLTQKQNVSIQAIACTLAGISLLASLITCYWFFKMSKKFRHKLIIMLIVADVIRSTWLFLVPLISLVHGQIQTQSHLCQASGFFIQTGIELADFAILVIAIHTALQVFQPAMKNQGRYAESGLYRYRCAVYLIAATLPPTMCSLAFTRRGYAYLAQGPTCSLPLRPFWYRLAISWIPRYLIFATVAGLYCAIYIHVRHQYGRVGFLRQRKVEQKPELVVSVLSNTSRNSARVDGVDDEYIIDRPFPIRHMRTPSSELESPTVARLGSMARRISDGTMSTTTTMPPPSSVDFIKTSEGIGVFHVAEVDCTSEPRRKFSSIPASLIASIPPLIDENGPAHFHRVADDCPETQPLDIKSQRIVTKEMRANEDAIFRQLRLLFAYPLCYFVMWLTPFISHVSNYNNYLAQHPIFVVTLLAFTSLSAMGAVDSLVFSLREQPWRHIPGSDGTFIGSFKFWQHDPERKYSHDTVSNYLGSQQMTTSPLESTTSTLPSKRPMSFRESRQSHSRYPSQASTLTYSVPRELYMIDDGVDVHVDMDISDPFRGGFKAGEYNNNPDAVELESDELT